MRSRFCLLLLLAALLTGCGRPSSSADGSVVCWPDYDGAVVPCNIAPLNVCVDGARRGSTVTVTAAGGSLSARVRFGRVRFPERRWHRLLAAAKGDTLRVGIGGDELFSFFVSPDSIDAYLTYRLIAPSYEVWDDVAIVERCLENFGERILSDGAHTDNACMNCHTHAFGRGDLSFFHLRGAGGGTLVSRDGRLQRFTLQADSMPVAATYGDWHPSGRYAVFSWNCVVPALRAQGSRRMEVYDTASDLLVADFDTGTLRTAPLVSGTDAFETFPTFSPDGRWIYFCRAPFTALPDSVEQLRYSLVRIAFDAATGCLGDTLETVWDAAAQGGSASFPKLSPDGRRLLFCRSDFGTFPIWHRETTLQMLDLATGCVDSLPQLAGDASSSYHSWSSDGRWIAFASKRGDGQYGRVYFAHVAADGTVSTPFLLPQRDAQHDRLFLKSYNIPDLGSSPVPFSVRDVQRLRRDAIPLASRR